jgi:hypothetical protein
MKSVYNPLRYGNIPGVHEGHNLNRYPNYYIKARNTTTGHCLPRALFGGGIIIRQEAGLYSMQELVKQAERKINV